MPISSEERATLLDGLRRSTAALFQALSRVPQGQLTTKPMADAWSPLGIIEHVGLVDQAYQKRVAEATPLAERLENSEAIAALLDRIRIRGQRITAPEGSWPQGIYKTAEDAMSGLERIRSRVSQDIVATPVDLKATRIEHPRLGVMTAYDAYLIMGVHGERHAAQLDEIAGF